MGWKEGRRGSGGREERGGSEGGEGEKESEWEGREAESFTQNAISFKNLRTSIFVVAEDDVIHPVSMVF